MAKPSTGKARQVAKLTKKQLGFSIGQNILGQLANTAAGIREIVEKGIDPATKQPLRCSSDDIKRSWSTEQLIAVEDFYTTFFIEPEVPVPSGKKK